MCRCLFLAIIFSFAAAALLAQEKSESKPNTLTAKEIAEGWILLFDGETTVGWKVTGKADVKDGVLVLGGAEAATATTTSNFADFELKYQRKLDGGSAELDLGQVRVQQLLPTPLFAEDTIISQMTGKSTPITIKVPAGTTLSLRGLKLKLLGLKPIFNGKDLTGWKEVKTNRTKSVYSVTEKGELNVKNGPGDLQTEGQWDDFILQMDVISNGKHLNSGVFFRALPGEFWSGYEAQIRNQWQGDDRTKPVDFGTGGIYNRQPARRVVSSDNEWFTMTVIAHGNHLATWVNGYPVADFADTRPPNRSARNGTKTDKGVISLQGHDPSTDLSFRNIRIAELPKAAEKK